MTLFWTRNLAAVALFALAGLLAALPAPARAETAACSYVVSLPAYMTVPGHYCLTQNFDYTGVGPAINISSDNVVFDCNDHMIANTGNPGQYNGIIASNNLRGVTIRNCQLDAFGGGIFVQSTDEPGATANVVEGNTVLRSAAYGITVYGSNNRIERNRVSGNTGGSHGQATGIELVSFGTGTGNVIRDNTISDFKPPLPDSFNFNTVGINFSNVSGTEVTGNTITGLYAPTGRYVEAIVSQGGSTNALVARNTVLTPPPLPAPLDGVQLMGIGIYGGGSGNICRDNVVGHFEGANLSGCVDSVNTDF